MSFLTMACSILLSMPTRLPEPLERHGKQQVEEVPPVSYAAAFWVLPALGPGLWPPHPPSTCDSTGSEGGGFCPSLGGVKVAAQGPPGPGGEQGPMPLGWGMIPLGNSGKTHRPFSGVPLVPSLPLSSRKMTPGTSQRPLAGTSLREGSSESTPNQRAVSDGAPGGLRAPPGRVGFCGCQAGREETGPTPCWPERYTSLPSPSGQGAAAIGPSGTRGPPPLAPQWAGIPRHTWSVPVSPSHPGTTPRLEGKGR